MRFNPLDHPAILLAPRRICVSSTSCEHIPFAFFCVSVLRPDVIVSVRNTTLDSYLAFCQVVECLDLPTKCYAFDPCATDTSISEIQTETLAELRDYHDRLYGHFSQIGELASDFMPNKFADDSIDLLHIGKPFTFADFQHLLDNWWPKLSQNAVILLHGINAHERDAQMLEAWTYLCSRFCTFKFIHSDGLGVAIIGPNVPEGLASLSAMDPQTFRRVSLFFHAMGQRISASLCQHLTAPPRRSRIAGLCASYSFQVRRLLRYLALRETSRL